MKLTLKEIQEITVGALQIWEEDGAFCFCKVTAAQQSAFDALSHGLYNNACATTGIRLDFHTDASFFSYTPTFGGKYELKLDGCLTDHLTASARQTVTVVLPKDGRTHRVTLHLPCHGTPGGLCSVELSNGATLTPHVFDRKLLFLGDSITQGWNSELDTLSYAYLLSDRFNAESVIQGVGGAYYDESIVDPTLKERFDADTVLVAYGTNDASVFHSLEEIDTRCHAFLEKLATIYPRERIRVITPVWRLDYDVPKDYGHVRLVGETIAAAAGKLGIEVVDGMTLIPPIPKLFADNVHPCDLGFALYAHNLSKALSH